MSRTSHLAGLARRTLKLSAGAIALAAALAALGPAAQAADGAPSANVAWVEAASDADIEKIFTGAKAQKKPVLLYWGAVWCPPCNQLKACLLYTSPSPRD